MRVMLRRVSGFAAALTLALMSASARAEDPHELPDEEGLRIGDWTFQPSVALRTRAEYRRSPVDLGGSVFASNAVQADGFGSSAPAVTASLPSVRDAFALSERARLGVGVRNGRVGAQLTLQDARVLGWLPGSSAALTPSGSAAVQPYEAYLDLRSDAERPGIEARIGRQAVSWGEGRLLGSRDWSQAAASFDAVRVQAHFGEGLADLEAFAALLAPPGSVPPPLGVNGSQSVGAGAQLFGVRNAWHLAALMNLEASLLARIARGPLPMELTGGDTFTADLRAYGDYRGVSYSAEGAYQLGRVAGYGLNRSLGAFAGAARLDWQTALPLDVRFGLSGAYASGDASGGNGSRLQRFDPILPDVHRHHGMMDLVAWSNLLDGAASVGVRPLQRFDAQVRYAFLGLAQPGDRWTSSGMLPVGVAPDNTSRVLGHELDARIAFEATESVSFDAGYGLMVTGAGARNILGVAGRSTPDLLQFGYLQASLRTR